MRNYILISLSCLLLGLLFSPQQSIAQNQQNNITKNRLMISFTNHTDIDLSFEYYGTTGDNDMVIVKPGGYYTTTVQEGQYDFHIFIVDYSYFPLMDFRVYSNGLIDEKIGEYGASYTFDVDYHLTFYAEKHN